MSGYRGDTPADSSWSELFTGDPLWDRQDCGSAEQKCCQVAGLPWFHKIFNSETTDYIELRVCADDSTSNEDIPLAFYEMYVK